MGHERPYLALIYLRGGMTMTYDLYQPGDNDKVPDTSYVARMRIYRDRLLAQSDWTQLPDAPVDRQAWADYRQALRDFPATWKPGPTVTFPDTP
jgi:Phage tail assembly chaperone protein